MDLSAFFLDLGTMAGLTTIATGWIVSTVGVPDVILLKKVLSLRQLISWVVAICIAFVGYYTGWSPMLVGLSVPLVAAHGFAIGLVANGVFKVELVRAILEKVRVLPR